MKVILLIIAGLISLFGISQKSNKEIKGDKYFDKYSFSKAINYYQDANDLTVGGQRNLAESYMHSLKHKESIDSKYLFHEILQLSGVSFLEPR